MKLYSGYIFDMDGVIYRGDDPIQDAVEVVNILKEMGRKVVFVTNNSSKLASKYKSILSRMRRILSHRGMWPRSILRMN